MAYFCPENTFLQLKHNIQVIYLTLLPDFQLLMWKFTKFLKCCFGNHKSFFTTQLLCIFLAQTLYTFYKNTPPKWKFSDFHCWHWNLSNSSGYFSNRKSVFLLKLDHSSVSWDIILLYFFSSVLFICYCQNWHIIV